MIGVIGAGTMGNGIAQVAAEAGYQVILIDIDKKYVQVGLDAIKKNLHSKVTKGKMEEAQEILSRIHGMHDLSKFDVFIEAIIEKMELEMEIYKRFDSICKESTVLASNTSVLSISEIAGSTNRSDKVLGMHFFNSVLVMELVEIIKGSHTSEESIQLNSNLVDRLGKKSIFVNEAPLFVVNRILASMLNEAIFLRYEGTASAEEIDQAMMLGANHPIGPLALADLIGLGTLLYVIETLFSETADSKYRPCPLLKKLVRAGHLGKKSGIGFYSYPYFRD
ncbi:3-hydroxyacyl-CoA dehydrogenase NAD-binding domain-containing protein [Peribacillus simplex]|uniref:3-hydroxyacyl-CoA dehydrogenase NAD-binding domain-containing protein n=1 Tax=Peribacillus simplex TaxID=1478 RepID=UPI0021A99FC5|nr:3-hydroxyacyl-CoA dehydrogenase NAD-binding domain-containing protein [Peribacillus simplex]